MISKNTDESIQFHIHPDIIDGIVNKNLVLFIGAGVSKMCGLPLWGDFANSVLNKCYKKGYINSQSLEGIKAGTSDPKKILSIARSIFVGNDDYKGFSDAFNESFKGDHIFDNLTENAKAIISFIIKTDATVVTTNADKILDCFFNDECIYYKKDDYSNWPKSGKNLLKIHGSIDDADSLVFTTDQYLDRYTDPNFTMFLTELFESKTIVFIGYGLNEFELLEYLRIKTGSGNRKKKMFVVDGYYSYQDVFKKEMEKYYSSMSITQIDYNKDQRGFDELAIFLNSWEKEIEHETNAKSLLLARIDEAINDKDMGQLMILSYGSDTLTKYALKKIIDEPNSIQNLEELIDKGYFKM